MSLFFKRMTIVLEGVLGTGEGYSDLVRMKVCRSSPEIIPEKRVPIDKTDVRMRTPEFWKF